MTQEIPGNANDGRYWARTSDLHDVNVEGGAHQGAPELTGDPVNTGFSHRWSAPEYRRMSPGDHRGVQRVCNRTPHAGLDGPSKTIIVEPIEAPVTAPAPAEPAQPAKAPVPEREREKVPA